MNICIRKATEKDAPFVALAMAEAIGLNLMQQMGKGENCKDNALLEQLQQAVLRTDTLYSWNHTLIAENEEGQSVGALIAYNGEDYKQLRATTFELIRSILTFDPEKMDHETQAGEYYLDSIAVLPHFRNQGIGSTLIRHAIAQGKKRKKRCVLACDPENQKAKTLYERLGFTHEGDMFIFGTTYLRMVL